MSRDAYGRASVRLSLRRPDDHERLVERARLEERSVSAELRLAIREHLGERGSRSATTADSSEEVWESGG